ncbi:MAG: amidohydrolase family protein [Cyclonatronaceae bacterium]
MNIPFTETSAAAAITSDEYHLMHPASSNTHFHTTVTTGVTRNMKKTSLIILLVAAGTLLTSNLLSAQIAVKADLLYTMAGDPVENGVVLIRDGKIEQAGAQSRISVPDGYTVYEAPVVTPGLIDARTVVGLAGYYNYDHDQDQLERSNPFQPELRAFDAYNAREALVKWQREHGITTMHTGHGPGALASGQTMIVKTVGDTVEDALIDSVTMVAMTLGPSIGRIYDQIGSRSRAVAVLRSEFIKAKTYAERLAGADAEKRPGRDLKMEIMARVLNREVKALITAQTVTEIMAALRLKREFGFDLVLDGAAEAYLVLDEIKEAGVPVFIHPTMVRTSGETKNASYETAAALHEAGIPFAFQSGYEGYVPKTRVVIFEAAMAVGNGLPFEEGLKALTISPAELLGIADRVGSIERGKDADLVLFEGDPFEYTTRVCMVIINGEVASDECR